MDEPRRARRRPGGDVVLLDERGPQAARVGVEQRAGADDPATDDDDVPRSRRRARRGRPGGASSGGSGAARARRCVVRTGRVRGGAARSARAASPVPTISTTMTSGVWKIDRLDVGREQARSGPPRRGRRRRPRRRRGATSRQPGWRRWRPAQPRSASGGMPIGATRTLPGVGRPASRQQPGLGPMEGDGQVGPDGRVGRLAARQVDRRRACRRRRSGRRRRGARDDELDGGADRLAEGAADAGAEQRVDDDRRLLDALAEDGDVAGDRHVDLGDPGVAGDPVPVARRGRPRRPRLGGDERRR